MIVLPSIRHTGTRFTRELIGDCISRHIGEKFLDELEPYIDNNIVIPMRRLDSVIYSWEKRQLKLTDLYACFDILVERYHHRDPFYFPVDATDRDKRLAALNRKFGLSLATDWAAVGTLHRNNTTEHDSETAAKLHQDFDWLFEHIYGRS